MNRALFLDLDDTLITTKSGNKFPKDETDWKFLDNTVEAVKLAKLNGLVLVIVSNQGGIEKGFVSEAAYVEKLLNISTELETLTGYKLGEDYRYYYCPHFKDHYDRKPNPGMAYQAAVDMQIYLRSSIMIGNASGKKGDHSADDLNFQRTAGIGRYIDVRELDNHDKHLFQVFVKRDRKSYEEQKDLKDFYNATFRG